MTDYARQAAEKVCALVNVQVQLIIQSAIDAATADMKAGYDEALNALDVSHKVRDEQAKRIQELEAKVESLLMAAVPQWVTR